MNITMLGSGLIGRNYTTALNAGRSRDRVTAVYSRTAASVQAFAQEFGIPHATTDMHAAITDPSTELVVIGLPNHLHEEAVMAAVKAGKGVLCTKPLGRTAAEAYRMLKAVEDAGVFHGYLEDLTYTPKTLKALESVRAGAIGTVLWARGSEKHPGPHRAWFWDKTQSGGGAIIDMGCHCIEISRNFIGKDIRPVEVMCWADTQVHPIEAEDHAVGMVRYENGAMGQFEVSWSFRGGMDLRDEVAGTEGTIWLNHWQRTGFELYTATGQQGYVAEKAEGDTGWMFPVGDEQAALGFTPMFHDMLEAYEQHRAPMETFYDGYVVNAIMDAAYASVTSKRWEPVQLQTWRGRIDTPHVSVLRQYDDEHVLIKQERMPDGALHVILRNTESGALVERIARSEGS
ncbi:MAG: Gfo/Idh/MocA family protein [Roseiflexaceae bacterium]